MKLAYIMVIQGSSGRFRWKLLLHTSLKNAGADMIVEAANGYAVVFIGAILEKNLQHRRDTEYSFERSATFSSCWIWMEMSPVKSLESSVD